MFRKLILTRSDPLQTIVRLALGVVMFAHGAQKLLGWFGGSGLEAWIGTAGQYMGLPPVIAILVVVAEFFGSLGLIVGLFSRVGAAGIIAVMAGAVALVHAKVGFFMNSGAPGQGGGYEYHILAIALALAVLVRGSGAFSLDRALVARLTHRSTNR